MKQELGWDRVKAITESLRPSENIEMPQSIIYGLDEDGRLTCFVNERDGRWFQLCGK